MSKTLNLSLEWLQPDPTEPGRSWPAESIIIDGHHVHLYAIRVEHDADGVLGAFDPQFGSEVDHMTEINGAQLQVEPLPGLEGKWVICATSFGD